MPPLLAIFLWPLVMLVLFKRFSPQAALCWSIIAGYLFLPTSVGFNLPMLPPINKDSHAQHCGGSDAVCYRCASPKDKAYKYGREGNSIPCLGWLPRSAIGLALFSALVGGAFLTVLANGDRLTYGATSIPGLRVYDGFAAVLSTIVSLLPLLLARKFLASTESHKTLLVRSVHCRPDLFLTNLVRSADVAAAERKYLRFFSAFVGAAYSW